MRPENETPARTPLEIAVTAVGIAIAIAVALTMLFMMFTPLLFALVTR